MTRAKNFAEAIKMATELFQKKVKEDHDRLIAQGYRLVEQRHDEWVYLAPTTHVVRHGRLHTSSTRTVTVPHPDRTVSVRIQRDALRLRVQKVFPDAEVTVTGDFEPGVEVEIEGDFVFKFSDMPLLAEAFGTEHLSFRQTAKTDGYRYSSRTWDESTSQKLFIDAKYDQED